LITPSSDGLKLDVAATSREILAATLAPRARRVGDVVVAKHVPQLTTKKARGLGITRVLASYSTYYSGTADRIQNLQLAVKLLDGTLVAPGGTFSLNEAVGPRTLERGFRVAPVIIGNEYEEEVGGGTSQVATTVFNAAWEAGVKVLERNPHSLYISRYQLGRDATVYWPSLDVKFVNDTKSWVLVKGFAEGDGISVSIYGGERRRVESSGGTRSVTGPAPVKRVKDPTIPVGKTVVEAEGSLPSKTSVTRTIYDADGKLIDEETWSTSYKGETRIVRVGTKPKAPKKPAADMPKPPADEGATSPLTRP
jgi:vancomycin resistance protein YoaR